uniref:Uncharacterized protein n=1 Tax=Anguilla anguilla TaxID=7936 RepID=A0A0E9VTT8_ANGAN
MAHLGIWLNLHSIPVHRCTVNISRLANVC